MSSTPFYSSGNNHFSTNEPGYVALPSSVDLADGTYRPESNESNTLLEDDENKFDVADEQIDRPWRYKVIALLCALSLAVGSHYAGHTLGALKSTIKEELEISNSQYGVIQSSVSLVNTILPILGGVFIDTFGTSTGSILSTSLIAAGNILVALSTNLVSFPVMVFGRILYGIGSGTIVTIQTTILSHWFKGKGLSIVIGVQIAASRLSSFLANLTVVQIKDATGFYGWAFWFAAFLCVISLLVNVFYIFVMKIINENLSEQELLKLKQKKTFSPRKLLYLPAIFWIIVLLEFEFGSSWTSFLHIHAELLKIRWGLTNDEAGKRSSLAQLLPIFIAPFLGYFLDRFGRRSTTWMLLFSISLSFGPVCLVSSIPILLPLDYVGTGLGIVKSCSNIGSTLCDIIIGILQDLDGGQYRLVMQLYLVICTTAIIVAVWLSLVAKKWYDGVLDMNENERNEYYDHMRRKHDNEQERENLSNYGLETLNRPSRRNWVYIITFVVVLILSWILFFIFVI
ncbi:10817_t:CDS:2 [Scutellospora calospora]|uniref:10817_t:CDS:1 n=1 Tax=Scutellospora calospora TaxID=85575 RepID=A0ACA9L2Y5_9GLOM|nr:10817_t:CDS:2 [Scutellospora calospora]